MLFHDRHEHLVYLKAQLTARRIRERPAVIRDARAFIDRFWRNDPHAAHYLAVWTALLDRPAEEIAARLVEDSPAGRYLRETSPVLAVITAAEVAELQDHRRAEALGMRYGCEMSWAERQAAETSPAG